MQKKENHKKIKITKNTKIKTITNKNLLQQFKVTDKQAYKGRNVNAQK